MFRRPKRRAPNLALDCPVASSAWTDLALPKPPVSKLHSNLPLFLHIFEFLSRDMCRCSGYRGIPVHLLLGPVIGPSLAQGKDNDPSYGEDPHEEAPREENDDQNC
jgi:hypothetical protein